MLFIVAAIVLLLTLAVLQGCDSLLNHHHYYNSLISIKSIYNSNKLYASTDRSGRRSSSSSNNSNSGNGIVSSSRSSKNPSESKTDSIRQSRVARSIRDELSDIICNVDIKANAYPDEDLLKATSIVDVEISSDLSYAKVYITVLGNAVAKRQVFVWLCENIGQVRYSLAKRLRHMRKCPEIFIKLADTQASHLLSVMEEIAAPKTSSSDIEYEYFEEQDNSTVQ